MRTNTIRFFVPVIFFALVNVKLASQVPEEAKRLLKVRGFTVLATDHLTTTDRNHSQQLQRVRVHTVLHEVAANKAYPHDPGHILTENFEDDFPAERWAVTADPTWGKTGVRKSSGDFSVWCAAGGEMARDPATDDYPNNAAAMMVYGPFSLRHAGAAEMTFGFWLKSELNRDWLFALISRDGSNFFGLGISGDSESIPGAADGWLPLNVSFNDYPEIGDVTGDDSLWLAFLFSSDSAGTDKGAFIDNVVLQQSDWRLTSRSVHLQAVQMLDAQTALVAGASAELTGGAVLKTEDGGATWKKRGIDTSNPFNTLFFIDETTGWVAGGGGFIMRSDDSGDTWRRQDGPGFAQIYDLHFVSPDTGWMVGMKGSFVFPRDALIARTNDGGEGWIPQGTGIKAFLQGVHFVTSDSGWAVGIAGSVNNPMGGIILRTTSGGRFGSWKTVVSGSIPFMNDLYFQDTKLGWAVGADGTLLKTTDGGTQWQMQTLNTSENLLSITFLSQTEGIILGSRGLVLSTGDGGNSWQPIQTGASAGLFGSDFVDANTGLVVGSGGTVLKTGDGGKSWREQPGTTGVGDFTLRAIHFTDAQTGYIAGNGGALLKTADGGLIWRRIQTGISTPLTGIYFANAQTGWVVGIDGVVLATADAGLTWTAQTSNTTSNLQDIYFTDSRIGWAVGDNGQIIHTVDGGINWVVQNSGRGSELHGVHFISSQQGWVVGWRNTVLATEDGGQTWNNRSRNLRHELMAVQFLDAQNGWAVGRNAFTSGVVTAQILNTKNGGETWDAQGFVGAGRFDAVRFFDANHGWVVGGGIYKTEDGGATWKRQISPAADLFDAYFVDSDHGWAVGAFGTIIQTGNGGVVVSAPEIADAGSDLPETIILYHNYPNPFNAGTLIRYRLSVPAHTRLRVFNLLGQLVRTLVDQPQGAGEHIVRWNGLANHSRPVASGVYFYQLETPGFIQTRKMILLQ
jgi:photosystem II stability/assembly factor-like uncharacterized protein